MKRLLFAGVTASALLAPPAFATPYGAAHTDTPAAADNSFLIPNTAWVRGFAAPGASMIGNVRTYGAKGDAQIASPTVTIGSGSAALTVGSATFSAADVGKVLVLAGAGVAPTIGPVMTDAVLTAGSGYTSVPACAVADSSGSPGSGATCIALMKLVSATVASGGTGCTNGSQTFIVGIDATGTPGRATGTVSGGALSGALTIALGGIQTALSTLSGAPGYGIDCSGSQPTFNLSYGVAGIQMSTLGAAYSTTLTTVGLSGGSPSVAGTLAAPLIGAPVPPLVTTIASYTSPTQVTLAATASTAISGATTKVLWATNDSVAFQNAITAAVAAAPTDGGEGVWIPGGSYWVGTVLDPGRGKITFRGEGMHNSVLIFDAGTSGTQDTGNWTPLFKNLTGHGTAPSGHFQLEDLQVRGLVDFGRFNIGGPALEFDNYFSTHIDRVKFNQIPFMAMQIESSQQFSVTNSVFENVVRDQARCRSCFTTNVSFNVFKHSNDDSIALHQAANYLQAVGQVGELHRVVGNYLEDTTCVHVIAARNLVLTGNTFRRCKLSAINISYDSVEGLQQLRSVVISDNNIQNTMNRVGIVPPTCSICMFISGPNAPTAVTSFLPGANAYPSAYFGKPWDYDNGNATPNADFAPSMRGLTIHDNIILRSAPAVAHYSDWGYGKQFGINGLVDPPESDVAMTPSIGIATSALIPGVNIHHNDIQDASSGISIGGVMASPSQSSVSISFNHIYNTVGQGLLFGASGSNYMSVDIIGNQIDVDPYGISGGRSGGHGGWSTGYGGSNCITMAPNAIVKLALNEFGNCYRVTGSSVLNWVISNNTVRGRPSVTGDPTAWQSDNLGMGVYPALGGNQFNYNIVTGDVTTNPPSTLGAPLNPHPTSSAAAPTAGQHYIGDIIWSTDPVSCTCAGWVALTRGTAWVSGTDFKKIGLQ